MCCVHILVIFVFAPLVLARLQVGNVTRVARRVKHRGKRVVDLSKDFERAPHYNKNIGAEQLIQFADKEPEVRGFMVLEKGKIVADYYEERPKRDETTLSPIWSCTKSWTSLLFGVMEKNKQIKIHETLENIWPANDVWNNVAFAEEKKKITIESLLTMTSGLQMRLDALFDILGTFDNGILGGSDFKDSLEYNDFNIENKGKFVYLPVGNLMSYIVMERTGMTPEEYAALYVFPHLGIWPTDYNWHKNRDGVSYAWHGIFMDIPAMAKLGMLYMQGGKTDKKNKLVKESWVSRSTDRSTYGFYGFGWDIHPDGSYCANGFGGQLICVDREQKRVLAMTSDNYIPAWAGGEVDQSAQEIWRRVRQVKFRSSK